MTEPTGPPGRSGISAAFGLVGAVVGAVAAGAAAGVAAERYAVKRRRRRAGDPYADEPFGQLPADASFTFTTSDGVDLHVEVVEPWSGRPDLTVVFVHGFCLDMGTWHFQRAALDPRRHDAAGDGKPGPRIRMVFYDQPGHGRSGRHPRADYRLDQLGAGLGELIAEVAPDGPLVLAGHSMGGMAIMALAEQQPDLVTDRVVGVALVSTSAGHLDDVSLGLPPVVARFRGVLTPTVGRLLRWQPTVAEYGRRAGSDLAHLLTKRYGFGTARPSPTQVE
ncbi:MAG TPA: alpha/beta hydrolase, partial [Cryptosporangiaceae bacterium]|nr:alpha/beta hydrolase [Cryptosporangiaceae bacterium]